MQNFINNCFALEEDLLGKMKQRLYLSTQGERKEQKILYIALPYFFEERKWQRNLREGARFISANEFITWLKC